MGSNILRIMYWSTSGDPGSVKQGGMDGSDVSVIVTRLNQPRGITIDFKSSRIYWTVSFDSTVQSSDMQGKNVQTGMQLPRRSWPYGMALHGNKLYVTNL